MKRIPINQWFDNYSLKDPNTRTELQIDGLQESSEFLRRLVEEEAKLLSNDSAVGDGYSRIVIGGLSQGCAAAVFCLWGDFLLRVNMERANALGDTLG
jgi:predicted esterase